MPRRRNISNTILETTGDERVVDDATASQLSRQVENDQREYAAFAMFPGGKEAPLWDCLEKSWTKPLPKERIYDCYLPKRVIKCSACRYTTATSWTNGTNIQAHVEQVIQRTNEHQDAVIETVAGERMPTRVCSGCGYSFQPAQATRHLNEIREMATTHTRVVAQEVNRFALEPSEPVIHRQVLITGPEVHQEEPASPQPGRRRRRRRRGNRT